MRVGWEQKFFFQPREVDFVMSADLDHACGWSMQVGDQVDLSGLSEKGKFNLDFQPAPSSKKTELISVAALFLLNILPSTFRIAYLHPNLRIN